MAFDARDHQVENPTVEVETVERIEFVRDRNLPGVKLRIHVTVQTTCGGDVVRKITKSVPAAVVDANWPGTARTLEAHLLRIIDAAV